MPPKDSSPSSSPKNMESTVVDIAIATVIILLAMALLGSFFASVMGGYMNTISWVYTRDWKFLYLVSALVVGICDIVFLLFVGLIFKRYTKLREEVSTEQSVIMPMISPEEEFQGNWQDIGRLINSPNPSDWNMAILRADAQLDDVLRHLGYEGETIAERLNIVDPTKLVSMDRVWSAHRLRNTIAHDPLQQYTREMLTHALESYQMAFKELGVLHEKPLS